MGKMLKTSAENRKCMFPNCIQTLSIYNHEPYCHVHRDYMPMERKNRIIAQPVTMSLQDNANSEINKSEMV